MSIGWIFFIVTVILWHVGLYGMFKKAGITPWKALIPLYNTWCMVEKMELKKIWFFLQLIPVAGQFITIWITIKFVEFFGRFGVLQHAAAVFIPFIYFPYLGFSKNERFAGKRVVDNYKKSTAREWIDAAAFAIVAATLIRTFVFEAYTIPSPSMEKTLLVNDFLFVSKFSYGPRIPNTPIAMPFVHNTMPFTTGKKSYSELIYIPYTRWFASPVKRNDVVVFNFPANDTLINDPIIEGRQKFGSQTTYYQAIRGAGVNGREKVWAEWGDYIITRPVDKRENFIKRCVAVSGDVLQVVNGKVMINGQQQQMFPEVQRYYNISGPQGSVLTADILETFGIKIRDGEEIGDIHESSITPNTWKVNITNAERPNVKMSGGYTISDYIVNYNTHDLQFPAEELFPYYDTASHWSVDNYGPVTVPKKGSTIELTPDNVIRYRRCIETYEGNTFENNNGQISINGKPATSYTFKMDYYWMMGDNRHNSLDSRYWGFVPEDHVVGKASLIWFSWEGGPRWKRLFNSIK